jgi:hypothetical protein
MELIASGRVMQTLSFTLFQDSNPYASTELDSMQQAYYFDQPIRPDVLQSGELQLLFPGAYFLTPKGQVLINGITQSISGAAHMQLPPFIFDPVIRSFMRDQPLRSARMSSSSITARDGGIDLKDATMKVTSDGSSSALKMPVGFDMEKFSGFTFTISSLKEVKDRKELLAFAR